MTKEEIILFITSNPNHRFDLDLGDEEVLNNLALTIGTDIDPNDNDTLKPMYIDVLRDSEGNIYYFTDVVNIKISN